MKRDSSGKFVSHWDSEKKQRVSISLTGTAWRSLDEEAQKRGISRSELIEYFARSLGNEQNLDFNEIKVSSENDLLQKRILEQQQAIATLERQKQELAALLENTSDAIAQETERRITAILESITDAFVAFDHNWHYTYVNQAAVQILHKTPEELIGKHVWRDVFPELVGGTAYQALHRAVEEQVPVSWEEFGEPLSYWLEVNAYPSADGVALYFRDVTERKQAEAEQKRLLHELEMEHNRFEAVLRQLPTGVIIADAASGKLVLANEQAKKIVGYNYEESLELEEYVPITPFVGFRANGQMYDPNEYPLARSLRTGEVVSNEEMRLQNNNGSHTIISVNSAPILNSQNQIVAAVVVFQDITERKQIFEQLQYKERQQEFLIELNDAIRAIQDSQEIMWQVVRATGQHFQVNRCSYGDIDYTQEYVIVDRDYCNGVISVVGSHQMNSFGPEIITQLKQGETIVVDDVDTDPRTKGEGAAAFAAIQTKSLLCVPLVKQGLFVALFVLHHISPRYWTEEEVALMEQIAEQTWLAVERSRAEEELRESEAHLQLALKVGRMGAWDWDIQTDTLRWTEGHFTVLGLQPDECQPAYEIWANRVHPDDLAQAEAKFQQAMQTKKEYHHEYRLRWADNSIHWVEARGKFTYDLKGNPKNSIGVVIDITERKQAEQEREQLLKRERIIRREVETAQRQLATIFETSPVGMGLLDSEQRFIAMNEALAQINGLTREQHLGNSISDLFAQSDPKLVALFDEIYHTGNPFISPNFAVNVPGRSDRSPGHYNVYYLPTTNSNNQVEDVLVYVVDVTEQVKLERDQRFLAEASAVLASSLDYQTTLEQVAQLAVPELADWCTVHIVKEDNSVDQIAVAHIDPAKLEWAEQIRQKYPINKDDPRGAAWTLRTGKSDLLPDIPDEMLVNAARDPEHLEILRSVGFKSAMTVPLKSQDRILGVISFISAESGHRYDQSSLQLAEELGRRASLAIDNAQLYRRAQSDRAKAQAANRIKDEFLAVLSHELRSPLNPILGWTRLLRSKRLNSAKVDEALETIERNTKLQAQLIEDLLDVSRILQGKMSLNVAPVNLAATIEAALETVRLAAEAKNIHIQTTFNPVAGTVAGDTNRLQQVVWNLLSNAVKFTPSGGQVEVQLEQVEMYAQIAVKDTGIGIKSEFLPHVFEYFRQQDGATTRKFGGLGLGLAIVRHLTELHGGTVEADSQGENLGAIFTVKLPLNFVQQELSKAQSDLESAIDLGGIQILVVDDDLDMCDLAQFILTQAGAQVTTAASALEALTLLNQSVPNLILSDIGMPEMDGYSLIRQIRQYPPEQGGNIPAIALSAYAGEINQRQALQAGFQQHLAKPIDPDELVRTIAILLGNR